LPIYIVEPNYWALADTSARQWRFLAQSLLGLKDDLAQLGLPLILRTGDAVAEHAKLCIKHGITKIISHQETGNLFTFHRDRRGLNGLSWRNQVSHAPLPHGMVGRKDICFSYARAKHTPSAHPSGARG
jgi:deoxyribodipyrimidine photolyase